MALSQDEQRVLAEIERRLAAEDPGLASSLTTFRRPGPGSVLRSPRARIIGSLFTVLLVALVSVMVYAMIPFRAHGARTPPSPSLASQGRTYLSTTGSTHQRPAQQNTASVASNASASARTTASATGTTPSSAAPSSKASGARAHGTLARHAAGRSTRSATGPLPRSR